MILGNCRFVNSRIHANRGCSKVKMVAAVSKLRLPANAKARNGIRGYTRFVEESGNARPSRSRMRAQILEHGWTG